MAENQTVLADLAVLKNSGRNQPGGVSLSLLVLFGWVLGFKGEWCV